MDKTDAWYFTLGTLIWYDTVYLMCSKKLTGSQLSLLQSNRKFKWKMNKSTQNTSKACIVALWFVVVVSGMQLTIA